MLRGVFGADDAGSGTTTAFAVCGSALAAVLAARFVRGALGPSIVDEPAEPLRAVARGLLDGARAAARAPSVAAGFVALLAHRAAFGI